MMRGTAEGRQWRPDIRESPGEKARPENFNETIHLMTRRCFGWDYRQRAIYQITLVQANRRHPLLGRLIIDDLTAPPEEIAARVEPTALGEAILVHWKRIGDFTPEIRPLYCQLMPDHLHVIHEVMRPMAKPLGNAIGGFKTGCEKIYRELALSGRDRGLALSARNKGLALSASGAAMISARCETGARCSVSGAQAPEMPRLWAPGFQDTILFRAGQLDHMFNYLRVNPRRLAIKRLYSDLFRVVTDCRLRLGDKSGRFFLLGNRFLLERPLLQVQVSRADLVYRREPIRGGGKRIVRDATGVPQVDSMSAAFEEKCDRLLLLAPARWPFVPGEKPMTRADAQVMNRLSQWLAGEGAAEINYRGVTFAEVDLPSEKLNLPLKR